MNPDLPANLEEQVVDLRARVSRLEEALHSHGIVLQHAERQATETVTGSTVVLPVITPAAEIKPEISPPVIAEAPLARPLFSSSSRPTSEGERSLESRIGSQWFNRVGILAVLIGMAWFLKLAIDNDWIGPLRRVVIGLAAGAGLIAWSERFRSHGYAAFSYSLKALGSGILYLSLWAAFSFFHLVPAAAAFAAMILVTAFNGFIAWLQDAELLALYAIIGGFSTPILVSTGENHEVTLFSYLLLLDIAVLVLVVLRPWSRLLFAAFAGTVLMFAGWWFGYYSSSQSVRTAFFLGCFFLIFAFAPRLARVKLQDEVHISGWDTPALVLLPVADAILGFIGFYAIADVSGDKWAEPWLAVAFAAFYLLLLRFPERGMLHASPTVLSALHLTAAVVFLTIAIPLKAEGRWLTIGWLAEGAALLWVASRVRSELLRVLALLCLVIGLAALLIVAPAASTTPFFNQRFGTYAFSVVVFGFVAWVAKNALIEDDPEYSPPWPTLAAGAALAVNALILLAICWEIHGYWWYLGWQGNWNLYQDYRMYAQFTYSASAILSGNQGGYLPWCSAVFS